MLGRRCRGRVARIVGTMEAGRAGEAASSSPEVSTGFNKTEFENHVNFKHIAYTITNLKKRKIVKDSEIL